MKYRKLGRTGMKVSEIGIGCGYFGKLDEVGVLEALIDQSIDAGINLLDVCLSGYEIRDAVGKAIQGRRDRLVILGHIGMALTSDGQEERTQDLQKSVAHFEDMMLRLETDYIDVAMLYCIDKIEEYEAAIESGLIDYMLRQKEKGVVRGLGFSSHDTETASAMVKSGHFDVVMFSVNPIFDLVFSDIMKFFDMKSNEAYPKQLDIDPRRAAFYALCEEKGIGIIAMKALAAGGLLNPLNTPFAKTMTVPQCIHYALNRPAVSGVTLGYSALEQLHEALSYYSSSPQELEYSAILGSITGEIHPKCLYCNHCLPCTSRINIGETIRLGDAAASLGVNEELRAKYSAPGAKASVCTECGLCMPRCPFNIDIIQKMRETARLFGE